MTPAQLRILRDIALGNCTFTGSQRKSLEILEAAGLIQLESKPSTHWGRTGWLGMATATEKGRQVLEARR